MIKKLLSLAAVALMSLSASAAETVLFEGEQATDWYPGFEIEKDVITAAGEGATLAIDVTLNEGVDGWSYKLSVAWTGTVIPSFAALEGYSEQWNTVWTSATHVEHVFTAEDIEVIAADNDKLHITGGDAVINKITLITADSEEETEEPAGDANVLFEGEQATDWYPGFEIEKDVVVAAGAGSTLAIDVTLNDGVDGWSYKLSVAWTGTVIPSFAALEGYSEQWNTVWTTATHVEHVFTAEDIEVIAADSDKLHITGGDAVINKITLTPAASEENSGTTVVRVLDVNENAPVEYYNLQGVRVNNPESGLYIRRQGNQVSKVLVK